MHRIVSYHVEPAANGLEKVRLDFTDLTPKLSEEILSSLKSLPGSSDASLDEHLPFAHALRLIDWFEPDKTDRRVV
jgi:hypothetical protein